MSVKLTYLGISAFELTTEKGRKILIDPCISRNPTCPVKVKDIKEIDLILVTHGAWDHLGDTIEIARNTNSKLICGSDVKAHAIKNGIPKENIESLPWGGLCTHFMNSLGIKVRAVESKHTSFLESNGEHLSSPPLGYVIYADPNVRIYHPGDTALFSDLKLIGEMCRPNIALFPVGASSENGHIEITPIEAAIAIGWIGPNIAIPIHYVHESDAREFIEQARTIAPNVKTIHLTPGASFTCQNELFGTHLA